MVVSRRSMRRVRASAGITRWVFYGVACTGILATLRYTLIPPRPARPVIQPVTAPDRAAELFAMLFAHSYLTWDSAHPELHQRALASMVGAAMDPDAGLQLPGSGSETVQWTAIAQSRVGPRADRIYTVAAQTDRNGLIYLTVDVGRGRDGSLRLVGYPALVGPPLTSPAAADPDQGLPDVGDGSLIAVVRRALRNYLAGSANNLSADLTSTARVSFPGQPLQLRDLNTVKWAPGGGSVLATLHATSADGADYMLRYELDVARLASRWEIAAIQMDPTT